MRALSNFHVGVVVRAHGEATLIRFDSSSKVYYYLVRITVINYLMRTLSVGVEEDTSILAKTPTPPDLRRAEKQICRPDVGQTVFHS